jgi:hypothetical protein
VTTGHHAPGRVGQRLEQPPGQRGPDDDVVGGRDDQRRRGQRPEPVPGVVVDQRGHLGRERGGGLGALAGLGDQCGDAFGELSVKLGAEDPGRLGPHHHRHARRLGDFGPGQERGAGERVGGGEGVGQDQRPEPSGVGQRVLLGDGAAHGHPAQVEVGQLRGGHHLVQVGGHLGAGVRAGWLAGPAHAPVVEGDQAQARGQEVGGLVDPAFQGVADAVDQDQRVGA